MLLSDVIHPFPNTIWQSLYIHETNIDQSNIIIIWSLSICNNNTRVVISPGTKLKNHATVSEPVSEPHPYDQSGKMLLVSNLYIDIYAATYEVNSDISLVANNKIGTYGLEEAQWFLYSDELIRNWLTI